ncbi:hypothetical protein [Mucilaginibacter sp.]
MVRSQLFAHLVQWFILLLQHGVLAKEIVLIADSITIVMKKKLFHDFDFK